MICITVLTIKNINSKIAVNRNMNKKAIAKMGFLNSIVSDVPVFLVNEQLMDQISPPKKGLNRECVREILSHAFKSSDNNGLDEGYFSDEEVEKVDGTWGKMEECRKVLYPSIGVYMNSVMPALVNKYTTFKISGRAIFICPERVKANSSSKSFDDIFLAVLFHEFVHAYISGGYSSLKYYEQVIEESLADAISFSRFTDKTELFNVSKFLSDPGRPAEYTGYVYWTELSRHYPLIEIVDNLKRNRIPLPVFSSIMPFVMPFVDPHILHHLHHYVNAGKDRILKHIALRILMHS